MALNSYVGLLTMRHDVQDHAARKFDDDVQVVLRELPHEVAVRQVRVRLGRVAGVAARARYFFLKKHISGARRRRAPRARADVKGPQDASDRGLSRRRPRTPIQPSALAVGMRRKVVKNRSALRGCRPGGTCRRPCRRASARTAGGPCLGLAVRHNYLGHSYLGHNNIGHDYLGHDYLGHSYLGHTYIGPNYLGQNDMGGEQAANTGFGRAP